MKIIIAVVCIGVLLLLLTMIKNCNDPTYIPTNSLNVVPCGMCLQACNTVYNQCVYNGTSPLSCAIAQNSCQLECDNCNNNSKS